MRNWYIGSFLAAMFLVGVGIANFFFLKIENANTSIIVLCAAIIILIFINCPNLLRQNDER